MGSVQEILASHVEYDVRAFSEFLSGEGFQPEEIKQLVSCVPKRNLFRSVGGTPYVGVQQYRRGREHALSIYDALAGAVAYVVPEKPPIRSNIARSQLDRWTADYHSRTMTLNYLGKQSGSEYVFESLQDADDFLNGIRK